MIFFDGEEAFNRWSATDSLYGSRNLAQVWGRQDSLQGTTGCITRIGFWLDSEVRAIRICLSVQGKKEIDTIDLFVLLDLLGQSSKMSIENYFQNTAARYQ